MLVSHGMIIKMEECLQFQKEKNYQYHFSLHAPQLIKLSHSQLKFEKQIFPLSLSFSFGVILINHKSVIFNQEFPQIILISLNKKIKFLNEQSMSQKQTNTHKPFDYLKGKDQQFQKAMGSIDSLYDQMFGDSSKYDEMFETFKTQNNPITASIDQMSREIFDLDAPKDEKYVKVEIETYENTYNNGRQDDEESIVLGQVIYVNSYGHPYHQEQFRQ